MAVAEKVSKIPSVSGGNRLQSCLPRPTSLQSEHQVWKSWIGSQVAISGLKVGTLLFYGKTQFAEGFFCGICLDEPEGKNDGSVNGIRYFTCEPKYGVFAPVTKVQRIETSSTQRSSVSNGTRTVAKTSLPSPVSASKNAGNMTFTRILQELESPGNGEKVRSPIDYGAPFNVSFTIGQPKETRKSVLNRTFEKCDQNSTFVVSEEAEQPQTCGNSTFRIESGCLNSPQQNETFCIDGNPREQQMLFDITEDDMEESSLGILSASQMIDLSNENLSLYCDIPKTQSCDDINDLPEDEMVEDVVVEYLYDTEQKGSFSLDLTMDATLANGTHEMSNNVHTSTPVRSVTKPSDCLKNISDFQMIKKAIELNQQTSNKTFPVTSFPEEEDDSMLESQALSCSFQDVTIHTTVAEAKLTNDDEASIDEICSSLLLSKTIVFDEPPLTSTSSETIKPNIAEELDLLNETIKSRLASEDLTDLDRVGRVSIEAVMEVIQRQEMYKNRPASTYTVGSADTGYHGDGECDCHSETAGSPCEEIKPLSLCSQEETDNTDRMMKSGHMSDSDFFTDQGASSEMELDGEMKHSISSLLSEGRTCDIAAMLPEEMQIILSVADEEKNTSSSAEGDQTVVEDSERCTVENRLNETMVFQQKQENRTDSPKTDLPESIGQNQEGETSAAKSSTSGRSPKNASRTKPETKKSTRTARTLAPPEPVKKIVRSPRKSSRWDAVTSKIAAGMAEEKTKERKQVKSRVDTNLTGARQVDTAVRKNPARDSLVETPSRSDSTPQGDLSKGTNQGIPACVVEAKNRVPQTPLSRPISPAVASELSSTASSSPSSFVPKVRMQSKIALPKRNLTDRNRLTKATGASSTDSKKSRPTKTTATLRSTQQQPKAVSAAPPPRKTSGAAATNTARLNSACPPKSAKTPESTHSKPTKSPICRTPVLSSRAAHAKIEDLTAEVQRLGALCEQRTKELNMVKMQLKHTYCGFDAFAIMVNYLVGELDAFSHPKLLADMKKTREQLASSQELLGQYETDLDSLKKQHSEEVCELARELDRTRGHVASLSSQLEETQSLCRIELEEVRSSCTKEIEGAEKTHNARLESLQAQHQEQIREIQLKEKQTQEETKRLHEAAVAELLTQLDELKLKSQSLEQESKNFEEALQKDTDSKIQWMYAKNAKLIAEVDSLKSVMDMKLVEIHSLRKENMELRKELDELPLAQKQIEKLRARNEDLSAVVREKGKLERRLSHEALQLKDRVNRVHKDNRRISMENEELQWKLQQTMDGSWSFYEPSDHEHSRRENSALPSPALTPCNEADENRLLNVSPINFYGSPHSTASSPAKSPTTPIGKRQRHSSLGPHPNEKSPCSARPTSIDRSTSLQDTEIYLKAHLSYDAELPFQQSEISPPSENGTHSDIGSLSSSTTGSSISSCDPEDAAAPQTVERLDPSDVEDPTGSEMCSPRSLAGEAMVPSHESPFDRSRKTPRTPEHHQRAPCILSDPDDFSCESE